MFDIGWLIEQVREFFSPRFPQDHPAALAFIVYVLFVVACGVVLTWGGVPEMEG